MNFRIADTFTDSLARLTGDEQKAAKTTAFDLQLNPASPGMSLHKLDRAKDKHFWSVRVSDDIRIVVHRTDASLLLCYVDHHDKAYQWAERRRLETHPKTGAAQWVERDYNGPARVSGSAGTGKTIVALHRAVHLARRHPESRVLLATFSDTLAHALRTRLRRLIGGEPRLGERLEVLAMDALAERLYAAQFGPARIASPEQVQALLATAAADVGGLKFSPRFLLGEWQDVVDAWQLDTWAAYRDVRRLGRRTRLAEAQRASLWAVFERVRAGLQQQGLLTRAQLFNRLAGALPSRRPPFDFAVIDECQDIGVAQLRFLAALGGDGPNALFFAGDLGQRIFQQPFSWKALGVDIRGRARTLHINYRTSHQIRRQADRLLGPQVADVDGNTEERRGTVSVFNGPNPQVASYADEAAEIAAVSRWLDQRTRDGVPAHEIAVIVRSQNEVPRARAALAAAQMPWRELDQNVDTQAGVAALCTMPLAKGLEFRAVAVMACDDEVIPLQQRIESIADGADLEEVYSTERHLLYVAATRARDHLIVSCVAPGSEFLDDLTASG